MDANPKQEKWAAEIPGSDILYNEQGAYVIVEERYPPSYLYGGSSLSDMLGIAMDRFGGIFGSETALSASTTRPEDYIFLDTETTGLSTGGGTVAFLIGVGFFNEGVFTLRQYFMRDYDDEPAMLFDLLKELGRFTGIVSFNGRAFDWNLIHSRLVYNRMGRSLKEFVHLDLLHPSRRIWKVKLESCSLSSIEYNILGEIRTDDIPGAFIPSAYFRYLDSRNLTDIKKILSHNKNDILSMVALMTKISSLMNDPVGAASDEAELYGIGRVFEAKGGHIKGSHIRGRHIRGCHIRDHHMGISESGTDNTNVSQSGEGNTATDNTGADNTATDNTGADNTGNDNTENDNTEVVQCFEACIKNGSPYIRDAATRRLSSIYKRNGDYEKAASHWEEQLQDEGCFSAFPAIELAKYYEHKVRNLNKALEAASMAMQIYLRMGNRSSCEIEMLTHRIDRLRHKITRHG